jgi:hypothetical protein
MALFAVVVHLTASAHLEFKVRDLDELHHQELESRLASVAGFREQQGSIAREMQYLRNERDRAKQDVVDQVQLLIGLGECVVMVLRLV